MALKFTDPIFDKARRTAVVSSGLTRIAKKFKRKTVTGMTSGARSGRIYPKGRGAGFSRAHRASRRGERPAVDTGNLIRNVEDLKTAPTSHEVFVDDNQAPYGKYLQRSRMNRPIMTGKDAKDYENSPEYKGEITRILRSLGVR